jgi:hypothetical protein
MSEKHVIHHRGAPRPDPDPGDPLGWLILGFIAVAAAIAVFNAIMLILPFLLAAGVISGATYAFLTSTLAKVKFKYHQLGSLQNKIIKSRNAELNAANVTGFLSPDEKASAVQEAAKDTEKLIKAYNDKRNEMLKLLEASLKRLEESKKKKVLRAKKVKSSEKFRQQISKLDGLITKLEASIEEIKSLTP